MQSDRYPWIVKVSRCGDKLSVYLSEDVPDGKEYLSNGGSAKPVGKIPRSLHGTLYKPSKVQKGIDRAQREADKRNAAEAEADEMLKHLALMEAGPE